MAVLTTYRVAAPRAHASLIAATLAGLFVALVAALHAIRTDLDPSWHMLSEYALGGTGWLMALAFFTLSASYAFLLVALHPHLRRAGGVIGRVFLVLGAVGLAMAGVFPMDPLNTPQDQMTQTAQLHGVAALLGIPGTLFAATFINWNLSRQPLWAASRSLLVGTAGFMWLTMIVFAVSMVVFMTGAPIGPDFLVGWQNRALSFSHALWVIALALRARRIDLVAHG